MTDDARQVLRDAREEARRGAHAEALEKYLWFYHHALEHSPALSGVRLSYAISEWVELGNAYPPALEALESAKGSNQSRFCAHRRAMVWRSWTRKRYSRAASALRLVSGLTAR